jgi:hypothetical protein
VYGRGLLSNSILSLDAGYTSLKNATLLHESGCFYVCALKENQKGLHQEATRLMAPEQRGEPAFVTGWSVYQGVEKRWKLYRTNQLASWPVEEGEWTHLTQLWLVVTEQRNYRGRKRSGPRKKAVAPVYCKPRCVEERLFINDIPWNYLRPEQILSLVRSHWGIENNVNWTCDVVWNEDDSPWCRKQESLGVLSLLRLMAYNLQQWLRGRHIRNQAMKNWGWRQWQNWIWEAMVQYLVLSPKGNTVGI